MDLLPDLAVRSVGGSVVSASDESFAERENLITPGPPLHDPKDFGNKGKVYDGWETRRRRTPGNDEAVIRLGVPGIVRRVVVDTSFFTGNYPPEAAVDGRCDGDWFPLVPLSKIKGDTENHFEVEHPRHVNHVRLRIVPDGGVARLRVHGDPLPDPALIEALGTIDLVAVENGGVVRDCSNRFYSSPDNLLVPGPPRSMAEGWETARRRDDGNDWVEIGLGMEGSVAVVELDTSYFLHNCPGSATLRGRVGSGPWIDLVDTPLEPDTRHRFVLADRPTITEVRLDILPDGGLARVRLWGTPTERGRADLAARWAAAHAG